MPRHHKVENGHDFAICYPFIHATLQIVFVPDIVIKHYTNKCTCISFLQILMTINS